MSGKTLFSLGKHAEALEYYQQILEMRKKLFKDPHQDIADSLHNVGNDLD